MYCVRKVTDDLTWVGVDDRRLAMFEGVYSVPGGVSYNSYLLKDEKTVLMDTVDKAVTDVFLENVEHVLAGRKLDYVVVQHMEPDHSAGLQQVLTRFPGVTVVCNQKIATMIKQFLGWDITPMAHIVGEGDVLDVGKHKLTFVMAPMVHWPEVMVTYDLTDKILFSADAFGTFGALNGALFNDEVDFFRDYLDEARRYYTNIVGKYGPQVQAVLRKAGALDIAMVCPLHGFVWRSNIGDFIEKYDKWSRYEPEEKGVVIAYASIYGHTENAANILACRLREAGIKVVMFDVSVTPASDIISACFKYSHLVFASATYNAGIFVTMEALLHDLAAHNLQNRTIALLQNGSWAPTSGALMRKILEPLKNTTFLDPMIDVRSALREEQLEQVDALVKAIAADFPTFVSAADPTQSVVEAEAFFKLSYGLFVLTTNDGVKDNGCIINTAGQMTNTPNRISISVNKNNYTHDMIVKSGKFNLSVLTESVPFATFKQFGFQSGKDADKMAGVNGLSRSANGLVYLTENVNAMISGKVVDILDYGTHSLFIAEVTEAVVLNQEPSVTYDYYFRHIKPKPAVGTEKKQGFVCKICGYEYEGDTLPADFICPLCKHGAEDFEPIK